MQRRIQRGCWGCQSTPGIWALFNPFPTWLQEDCDRSKLRIFPQTYRDIAFHSYEMSIEQWNNRSSFLLEADLVYSYWFEINSEGAFFLKRNLE